VSLIFSPQAVHNNYTENCLFVDVRGEEKREEEEAIKEEGLFVWSMLRLDEIDSTRRMLYSCAARVVVSCAVNRVLVSHHCHCR
jgi:hypothetical protein